VPVAWLTLMEVNGPHARTTTVEAYLKGLALAGSSPGCGSDSRGKGGTDASPDDGNQPDRASSAHPPRPTLAKLQAPGETRSTSFERFTSCHEEL
jgi:hypothetical protein